MTPLCGRRAFAALLEANRWLAAFLPNAEPRTEALADLGPLARLAQGLLEWPLRGRLGDALERRIQSGKLRQLQAQAATVGSREVVLESEVCKGHMDSHGAKIREEYDRRREHYLALGFEAPAVEAPAPQAPAPEAAWTE